MLTQLKNALIQNEYNSLTRKRYVITHRENHKIFINKSELINFSSNDYLCLSTHPRVKKAFIDGANRYGLGSGASTSISGFYKPHALLEEAFAEFFQRDSAILFNSGYLANLGVLATFANRHSHIIADKLCHASLLDGIQLSRARLLRYSHNNIQQAEKLLQQADQHRLLVTESIFSMEGDISPIKHLAELAKRHYSFFIVDDAHGFGVLGRTGRGICEHFQLTQDDIPLLITPLGKALGGMGAIVSGPQIIIENLLQFARTYRYTTALPPAIACAELVALQMLQKESWRREKLISLIHFFIKAASERNLTLINNDLTPIKSILIADNDKAISLQKFLMHHGFFVSCIRPPTVRKHTARLRLSIHCALKETDIVHLLDLIAHFYEST